MLIEGEKILITGTHGFLGRNLAKKYSRKGAKVYGIGHGQFSSEKMLELGIIKYISGDINLSNLLNTCENPDKIIHCASSSSVSYSVYNPREDFERTVNSTLSVLELMRLYSNDAKLVIPSSAAVYGQKENKSISVGDILNPLSPYGNSKRIAEILSEFYAKHYNLKISIVRLFSLYGPGLKKQLLWDACIKAKSDDHVYSGTGLEMRDWINIDDAASLLLLALENASSKAIILNGGVGKAISIQKVLTILYKKMGIDSNPRFSGLVREGDPFFYEADIKEAISWGWKPKKNLEDGIDEYVKWFKSLN